jgi:hypothetical protein
MNTQALLEAKLLQEELEHSKRERSGKFNPSSLGRCFRNQFWNRKDEPKSNPFNVDTLKIFALGNMVDELIKSSYPKECSRYKVDTEDICGYPDIVLDDCVKEVKSCKAYEFKMLIEKGYNIANKTTNCLQAIVYAYLLHKPTAYLVFAEKEALRIKEFELKLVDWQEVLMEELATLRDYWIKDRLPNGEPRAYGGKECKYCGWMDKCFKLDGIKLKEGK